MKMLFLINVLLQVDSLPPKSILISSIDAYYDKLLVVELKEFERADKRKYLKFLPSVGTGYAPNGGLRPAISFNFSSIISYFDEKERIKQLRESVILNNQLLRESQKKALENKLVLVDQYKRDVKYEYEVLEVMKQLHEIVKSKYEINKVLPSQLLQSKLGIMKQVKVIKDKEFKMIQFVGEVLEIAKY